MTLDAHQHSLTLATDYLWAKTKPSSSPAPMALRLKICSAWCNATHSARRR